MIFVWIESGVGDRRNEVTKHIDEIREEHEYGGFTLKVFQSECCLILGFIQEEELLLNLGEEVLSDAQDATVHVEDDKIFIPVDLEHRTKLCEIILSLKVVG